MEDIIKEVFSFFDKHLSNWILWLAVIVICSVNNYFFKFEIKFIKEVVFFASVGLLYSFIRFLTIFFKKLVKDYLRDKELKYKNKEFENEDYKKFLEFIKIFSNEEISFLCSLFISGSHTVEGNKEFLTIDSNKKTLIYISDNILSKKNNSIYLINNKHFKDFLPDNFINFGDKTILTFGLNFAYFLDKYCKELKINLSNIVQ